MRHYLYPSHSLAKTRRINQGVPSYSHIFKTATSQVVTTTFDGMSSKAFQTLDHKHPASDPSYTYKQLISKGVSDPTPRLTCGTHPPSRFAVASLGRQSRRGQLPSLSVVKSSTEVASRLTNSLTPVYDTCSQTPFLFSAYDRLFITYDDATSIGAKATYARSRGLGGVVSFSRFHRRPQNSDQISRARPSTRATESSLRCLLLRARDFKASSSQSASFSEVTMLIL